MRGIFRITVLAAAAAVTLAACGGSDTSDPSSGSAIKIGVLVNLTGPDAGENLTPPVLEAWADEVNKDGGVAGHKVEFEFEDTKGDAPTGTAAATKLIGDDDISAIVMFDAYAEGVYGKKISDAGLPVIGGMGYDPTVWGALPNWFPVTTTFPSFVYSTLVLAESLGDTNAGYVVCAEAPTCPGIGDVAKGAWSKLGFDYAGTFAVAAATPDYTAECLSFKKAGADFVALTHIASVNMRIAKTCKTQGFDGHFALNAGGVQPAQMQANEPGVKIELAMATFAWWLDDAPVKRYRDIMKSHGVKATEWEDPRSTAAYATMELFRKTLDKNASSLPKVIQRADVLKAYGTVKGETLDGLLPQPATYTAGKPGPQVRCYWMAAYEDGKFTGGDLKTPTCDPAELAK